MIPTFLREDFRIVHISIQTSHVHLLVEANGWEPLARGMQGFLIAAAKHVNAAVSERRDQRRKGNVFPDRYHAEVITTPLRARYYLAHVLNNWRHHGEDRAPFARGWTIDPFASGDTFDGWREMQPPPERWDGYKSMPVWMPKTAMLREDWRAYGLIDPREVLSAADD